MCISSPGRVLALDDTGATVDLDGRVRRASTLLLRDLAVGDHVLVAAGTVISRLDASEVAELNELLALARDDAPTMPTKPGGPATPTSPATPERSLS